MVILSPNSEVEEDIDRGYKDCDDDNGDDEGDDNFDTLPVI